MGNKQEKKVLCFGLVMADVLVNELERLPQNWEETVAGERSLISVGGGASNSARTFGRLGERVDLLGRVGNDFFGEFVRRECEADQVNCKALITDEIKSTGVAVGLVQKGGKRCFITAQGANRRLSKSDFALINPDEYDFLHINGYFQFPQIEPDLKEILLHFNKKNIPVSFDLASSDPSGRWYDAVKPFVDCLDYFFLNDSQLSLLTKKEKMDDGVKQLVNDGVKNVIVKLGADGCAVYDRNMEKTHVTTAPMPVIDTTGAGDSFDAAYVLGLRKNWSPLKCARFANTVAGHNCCKLGATAGVLNYDAAMREMNLIYK